MLLSIIVPVYNKGNYLRKCLDSLLNQSFSDYEIILIDDGSLDNSGNICDEYEKNTKCIKVIHQQNSGCCAARYAGLRLAQGYYVSFVDADDWVDQDIYESFLTYMRDDIDVICFGKTVETDESGSTEPIFYYKEGDYYGEAVNEIKETMIWNEKYFTSSLSHSLCDKIFKKEWLLYSYDLIKVKDKITLGEDALILFPLMEKVLSVHISHRCPYHYHKSFFTTPVYASDGDFFSYAFRWYELLKNNISKDRKIKKQLEYLYMNMVNSRREYWGDYVKNDEYIFPFHRVLPNTNIVLYGAGRMGTTYYNQLSRSKYCNNVTWVDKNYEKRNVESIDVLLEIEDKCQYIVVAIQSSYIRDEVIEWLKSHNIDEKKIIF